MTKPTAFPNPIELRQRVYLQMASQSRILNTVFIVLLIALAAMLWIVIGPNDILRLLEEMPSLTEWAAQAYSRDPVQAVLNLLAVTIAAMHLFYMQWAKRRERLVLTHNGIEYHSPLPAMLRFLRPGWSLSWCQIRAVTLENSPFLGRGPQMVALKLDGRTQTEKLYPWRWVNPQNFEPVTPWKDLRRQQKMTSLEIVQEIDDSPVMHYLAAALPHIEIVRSGEPGDVSFALEKNKASLTIAVLFFALVIYAFADGIVFGKETYAGEVPMPWFTMAGIFSVAFAGLWMVRSGVPKLESVMVALLFGASTGVAAYPAVLRINQLTDTEGLRAYEYVLQSDLITLTSVTAGPPDLSFPKYDDYWQQFESGSKHEFELRYGGLGFYQLNFEPVGKALRKYYEKQHK